MPRPATNVLPAAALAALYVCAAAIAGPFSSGPRTADSLTGRVSSATGHWHSHHGRLAIRLAPTGTTARRHLVIYLTARRCATPTACLKLHGSLTGTITALPGKPDVGRRFSVKAAGVVAPLGHVRATGTASGPGFISRGRVTLALTLTDARGSATVSARSEPVPGFTAP